MGFKTYINKLQLNYFWDKIKDIFDSRFVDKTSNETINGIKTFTNNTFPEPTSHPTYKATQIFIKNPNITKQVVSDNYNNYSQIVFLDKDGTGVEYDGRCGSLVYHHPYIPATDTSNTSNKYSSISLRCSDFNSTKAAVISVGFDGDGNKFADAPTPKNDDNSEHIATTAFVNNQIYAPIGCVMWYAGTGTPNFWKLCDGSAISRTDYAMLYSIIGTRYGSGNGSTTFNLPNLIDKFVEGNSTPGTSKNAGLPNITGHFRNLVSTYGTYMGSADGAFSTGAKPGDAACKGNDSTFASVSNSDGISFDASRSSSIYGNSTTVQPPALTLRPIIRCL